MLGALFGALPPVKLIKGREMEMAKE